MYAVASLHDANYNDLASLTDAPKQEYCERHGYKFHVLTELRPGKLIGFDKIQFTLDLMIQHPEYEWILFSECDAMITNLTIKIEDRIDNDYHFIIPVDRLNLNNGNFLARNSEQGRAYLNAILAREDEYKTKEWGEQQFMIDSIEEYAAIIKIVPQKFMNSYEQVAYDYCDARTDIFGNSGEWEPGDWIVHWPGTHHHVRLERASTLTPLIVR